MPDNEMLNSEIRKAKAALDAEIEKAEHDALVFGNGFLVDGKRVDPQLVRVYYRPLESKKVIEEIKRPYKREPLFGTNIRRAWRTVRAAWGWDR